MTHLCECDVVGGLVSRAVWLFELCPNILTCFGTRMLCGVAWGVGVGVGGGSMCASEVGGARRRAGGNAGGSVTVSVCFL